jgi:hypothetical protein
MLGHWQKSFKHFLLQHRLYYPMIALTFKIVKITKIGGYTIWIALAP